MLARRLENRARELLRVAARGKYSTIHLRYSFLLLYLSPLLLFILFIHHLFSLRVPTTFPLTLFSTHGVFSVASSPSLSFAISLFLTYCFLFSLSFLSSPSSYTNASAFLSVSFFRSLFPFYPQLSFFLSSISILFFFLSVSRSCFFSSSHLKSNELSVGYIIGEVMLPPARATTNTHVPSISYISCFSLFLSQHLMLCIPRLLTFFPSI